ncbi:cysteine peptidase family C39 domain-containing protein [Prochlorococcus sp. MIT 1306]|uniref:cysteine peptidase family C39 domain-containing protein n=1 Tax=Prochlorococcus sp. MIT 1306 TaxID=1799667 RepID=UPI0007B3E638|nr:cysteine peptidase family C39 domain-containing protein [Prochlorococcus sp. MIT 1306]KZR65034.1 Alpha-hemolysin translocation ATP-binding protein HlyB [Prochlorococcus sp. MIT 1306]
MKLKNIFQSHKHSVPEIYQAEESECGLACLAMLFQFHNGDYDLNLLRQLYGSTRGGINVPDLITFSSRLGLRLVPEKVSTLTSIQIQHLPCIALWNHSHFVVISDITKDYILVNDPSYGIDKYDINVATDDFSGLYFKSRIINNIFRIKSKNSFRFSSYLPQGLNSRDIGVVFLVLSLSLVLVASLFQVGNAQVQDVFFNWIVEMQMKQWSTPLGYVQIATALISSVTLLCIGLYVAKKYTDLSLKWNSFIYKRLLRLPEEYFLNRRTGDTISRFNYADNILKSSQASIVTLVVAFVNLSVLFMILSTTDGLLLIISMVAAILAIGIAIALNPTQRSQQQQVQQSAGIVEKNLYDMITDIDQIRLEGREAYYLKNIAKAEAQKTTFENRLSFSYAKEQFILKCLDNTTSTLLLIAAGMVIISGRITLGQYAAIDVLISTSLSPLMNLSGVVRTLQETNVAFQRLGDITKYPLDPRFSETAIVPNLDDNKFPTYIIQLSDVSFSYSAYSTKILDNVTIAYTSNDFPLVIKGRSGSGKSTLAKIIAGRLLAKTGNVQILDHDITNIDISSANRLIQLVDGNPYLRNTTIYDNLQVGKTISIEQLKILTDQLGVSNLQLFTALNRRVSSSYRDLSGGEMMLVQLIRALARKPKVLILDEILSVISPEYRSGLVRGITSIVKYSVFITHENLDVLANSPTTIFKSAKLSIGNGISQ